MRYSEGTITLTAGNPVITGTGTAFKANVSVGDFLTIPGLLGAWQISKIIDDTHIQVSTAFPYGLSVGPVGYVIANQFTPNVSMPLPGKDALDPHGQFARAAKIVDRELP